MRSRLTEKMLYILGVLLVLAPTYTLSQDQQDADQENNSDSFEPFPDVLLHKNKNNKTRMGDVSFTYEGPSGEASWADFYAQCGGSFQSPIDIDTDQLEFRRLSRPLKWSNMEKLPKEMRIEKTDTSLGLYATWRNRYDRPYVSGGPLKRKYYFYHLHLHWNTTSNGGSEHRINGKSFPLEMHAVYTTNENGIPGEEDKLLVLGYMVTLSPTDHLGFKVVTDSMRRVRGDSPQHASIPPFPLKNLHLEYKDDYVIYSGSLTTPPCTQGVTWVISSRPVPLSVRQYKAIAQAVSSQGSPTANARSPQQLNGRKVFYIVTDNRRE